MNVNFNHHDLTPFLEQFRRVFSLRRNESSSSDDDEPESPASEVDSDDVRSRRHLYPHQYARRMSLLGSENKSAVANNVLSFDLDMSEGHTARTARRFFHSSAVWDPALKTVVLRNGGGMNGLNGMDDLRLADVMERGGRGVDGGMDIDMDVEGDGDWKDGDVSISVES